MIYYLILVNNKIMYKSKLAILIDSLSATVIIFITIFFILRRYIKSAIFLIFCCIFASLLSFIAIFYCFLKKYKLNNLSFKESRHLENCLNSLKFSSSKTSINFFEKLLNIKYISSCFYENETSLFFINIKQSLSSNDFFEAIDKSYEYQKNLIFICEKYDDDFKNLLNSSKLDFKIFTFSQVYEIMKNKKLFPKEFENISFQTKLKNKFNTFTSTISKKHFKNYLFSGLSLLALSFFIPYSFYYSIVGLILLIFSILCLFKRNEKPIISKNSLSDYIK